MANNVLYIFTGDTAVYTPGSITSLVQGQYGQSVPLEIRNPTGSVVALTGYSTITGHRRKEGSLTVTPIDGTIVLSGTPTVAPQITWIPSSDDTAQAGSFHVWFEISNGSIFYVTEPVILNIIVNPDINASVSPGYVGVTTTARALLNALVALTGVANFDGVGGATAIKLKLNGTTAPTANDDSGDGYGVGSVWIDTTNDRFYVCVDATLTAAVWLNFLLTTGGAMSGTLAMADNLITRPKFTDYGETTNAIGNIGGGTQDIDITLGNVASGTVDTSATTFTFSNPSASGTACSLTLILENGGSQTVTWPTEVRWAGGAEPTLTTSGIDILTFVTVDAGAKWYGFAAGLDMQVP